MTDPNADAAREALLERIRRETREAVQEGDAQDCSSSDCIADAVYEIVRVAWAEQRAAIRAEGLDVERLATAMAAVSFAADPNGDDMQKAALIAAEYARLTEAER